MTNKHVKALMEKLENDEKPHGFFVVVMDTDDVDNYLPEDMRERFYKLTKPQQEEFLSLLMDNLSSISEESPDFGFRKLLDYTVKCLQQEKEIDNLFAEAEKAE